MRLTKLAVACVAVLVATAGQVQAGVITHSTYFNFDPIDYSWQYNDSTGRFSGSRTADSTLSIPKFDPSLGTLTSVEFSGSVSGANTISITNTSTSTVRHGLLFTNALLEVRNPYHVFVRAESSLFNSSPSDMVAPSQTVVLGSDSYSATNSGTISNSISLVRFVGPGDLSLNLNNRGSYTDLHQAYPLGTTAIANRFSTGEGELAVTYNFEPAAIPEPSTLAIWGILGGLGMIAARRRRKRA
jgi:hypothetical protein